MNKFITEIDGGLPLRLNDARWIESANIEMFDSIVRTLLGLNREVAKLYDCEVVDTEQGDVFTCSGGFIYFAKEIFYVIPGNVTHTASNLIFVPDVTYDSEGDKNFKNSVQHQTYERRRAKLVSVDTLPVAYADAFTPDFITIFRERLEIKDWTEIPLSTSNLSVSGAGSIISISGNIRLKLEKNIVYIVIDARIETDGYIDTMNISLTNLVKNDTSALIVNKQILSSKYPILLMSAEEITYTQSNLVIRSIATDESLPSSQFDLHGQLFYETF